MSAFRHPYPFDPSYGHTLASLLRVEPPKQSDEFREFWQQRFQRANTIDPAPRLTRIDQDHPVFDMYDLRYRSTDGFEIGGWALTPRNGTIRRGVIVGHGYGGRDGPDMDLPITEAVSFFPCFRGLSRSRHPSLSGNPWYHVLHDITRPDRYILGGCVEDLWLGISALLRLFPEVEGHIGFLGVSFGGGIGALALPWDPRIQRGHLNVPTFGHQQLRLTLPTCGSGEAVRIFERHRGGLIATLRYYDAAIAARYIHIPMHVAAALFDPAVAPPGQFAVYNALAGPKSLFVLSAGHFDYPAKAAEEARLHDELRQFFHDL